MNCYRKMTTHPVKPGSSKQKEPKGLTYNAMASYEDKHGMEYAPRVPRPYWEQPPEVIPAD